MVRTIDGAGTLEYTIKVSAENNFTPDRRFSIQFQTCSYFKTDFGQANRTISRGHEGHLAPACMAASHWEDFGQQNFVFLTRSWVVHIFIHLNLRFTRDKVYQL